MHHRPTPWAIAALVCVLLLAPAAFAGGDTSTSQPGFWTKQGVSGQVYAWQAGTC